MTKMCGDAGGTTKAGTPCRSSLNLGAGGLCVMHDPERTEQRRTIVASGGAAKGRSKREARDAHPVDLPRPPKTLSDAAAYLTWLVDATARGTIDVRTSHELAIGVRELRLALEKRDLQGEVAELRKKLKELQRLKGVA